jgi:endonuclease VIII
METRTNPVAIAGQARPTMGRHVLGMRDTMTTDRTRSMGVSAHPTHHERPMPVRSGATPAYPPAMPEGDTLSRTATTLERALAGEHLTGFEAARLVARRSPGPGWVVRGVEARGKHLLVHFERDGEPPLTLRTHLKMTGSWHVYRPGERWRKPRHRARVVIATEPAVAVCFAAPDADLDEAARRFAALPPPETPVAVALLDQRIACGVGNVYESEVLHACGLDPSTPVGALDAAVRRRVLATASRLLRANLDGYPRRTAPGGLAVYGRAGQPCRRCATTVVADRHGDDARITYWCPSCQPARSGPAVDAR